MGLVAGLLTGVTSGVPATAASTIVDKQDFTYLYDESQDDTDALEQSWKATQTGIAKVIAVGGGGSGATAAATSRGGNGAVVVSWHSVTKDEEWTIRVGGGTRVENPSTATGGSATAIVKQNGDPISVAGGGGGAAFGAANGGDGGFYLNGAGGDGVAVNSSNNNGKGGKRLSNDLSTDDSGGMGGDPDGGAGGTPLDKNGEGVTETDDGAPEDKSPGAGGGAMGGTGGNAIGTPGDLEAITNLGGAINYFGRTDSRNGGGGAGFGGGGAAIEYKTVNGKGYQGGSGGGGYTGGGAGGHDKDTLAGGGGAGSSFATTQNLPANHPEPTFAPGPFTNDGNAYGEGGVSSNDQLTYRGKDGFVRIELYVPTPTPPAPKPVVKTPGKPGAFKVTKKTTAKKRKFTWKASGNATKATVYTLEIRAKGKKKVLLRKHIKATSKRAVTYTRKQLIKKSRKYQKRAKTVKLRASIYAKTGSKKSATTHLNFNVRR